MGLSDRVTMADVAREVGVSIMTVSRVINGKGDVSPTTRERVLQAIERLGYRPSGIARGLATQRTGTLGLVVPDVANPFFAEVARGVEQVAYAEGYNVFLCNTNEDPKRELDVLGSLEEKRVDGIVLCSSRLSTDTLRMVLDAHPAVTLVNRRVDSESHIVSTVCVDDTKGGILVTEHLLTRGHQAIGFLAGPSGSQSGQRRVEGYLHAYRRAGLRHTKEWVHPCAPVAEAGARAATQLLETHPELTALLCYNDLVAVGALQAATAMGRRVPEDLAIVGFDDIPLAALVRPPLTTCHVPRYELGAQAVALLLGQIRGEVQAPQEIILEPKLIIRASAP